MRLILKSLASMQLHAVSSGATPSSYSAFAPAARATWIPYAPHHRRHMTGLRAGPGPARKAISEAARIRTYLVPAAAERQVGASRLSAALALSPSSFAGSTLVPAAFSR